MQVTDHDDDKNYVKV